MKEGKTVAWMLRNSSMDVTNTFGRKEGRKEGREEGRKEERKEGRKGEIGNKRRKEGRKGEIGNKRGKEGRKEGRDVHQRRKWYGYYERQNSSMDAKQ